MFDIKKLEFLRTLFNAFCLTVIVVPFIYIILNFRSYGIVDLVLIGFAAFPLLNRYSFVFFADKNIWLVDVGALLSCGILLYIDFMPSMVFFICILTLFSFVINNFFGKGLLFGSLLTILFTYFNRTEMDQWGVMVISQILLSSFAYNFIRFTNYFVEMKAMFESARWSASELPRVLTKIGDNLTKVRLQEKNLERKRVAREVHDTVGYALTTLISKMEVLSETVLDDPVRSEIRELEKVARKTLQNIRMEVDELRHELVADDPLPFEDSYRKLCDVFQECTGVKVTYNISCAEGPLSEGIGVEVKKIIQELLTNAFRHGRATHIDVVFRYDSDLKLYLFRVSDNGIGTGQIIPGNGLKGIRERVESLSGEMELQSARDRGFDIGIDIPREVSVG